MIEVNEVRIGNKIYLRKYKGHAYDQEYQPEYIDSVVTVDANIIVALVNGATHYFPIALTPKILGKYGFEENSTISKDKDMVYSNSAYPSYFLYAGGNEHLQRYYIFLTDGINEICIKGIEFLHELQNLTFVLSGEEII